MNVENMAYWSELLSLKDELSLRELSERFGATPGQISAALRRAGVSRSHDPAANAADDLPPEAGDAPAPRRFAAPIAVSPTSPLDAHRSRIGTVPDADIAAAAGVSLHAVANYRARNGIAAYRAPRAAPEQPAPAPPTRRSRIDEHAHLLGTVADRVVAEKAGVSLNAVRNYRARRGIPAAGRAAASAPARPSSPPPPSTPARGKPARRRALHNPADLVAAAQAASAGLSAAPPPVADDPAAPTSRRVAPPTIVQTPAAPVIPQDPGARRGAWVVRWTRGADQGSVVVLGRDLTEAATRAQALSLPGQVVGLEYAGDLLG